MVLSRLRYRAKYEEQCKWGGNIAARLLVLNLGLQHVSISKKCEHLTMVRELKTIEVLSSLEIILMK